MLNLLTTDKELVVNGISYTSAHQALHALTSYTGSIEILINSKVITQAEKASETPKNVTNKKEIYRIEVRKYMTEKSSPDFDFMMKYNNDLPMPLRRMYGEILEETKGMYKMRLHARAERNASSCSHCMRELTHPISMIYGIGPICGEHGYMTTDYTKSRIKDDEELFKLADADLRKTVWEGFVIKRAIEDMKVVGK
jgi:hypothetical protein